MFDESYDRDKSRWTKDERGIDFVEARAVWNDVNAVEGPANIKDGEARWLKIGKIGNRLWTVGFTYRETGVRIFSVRPPRTLEREIYEDYG